MMLALVAAALLRTATPSVDPPQIDRDAPQADEMVGAAAFGRAMAVRDFAAQIFDLDAALAKLPRPTRYRGMVQCYRGWVLSELGRRKDSDAAIEECYRLRPDDSYALWQMASIALQRRDVRRGARLLIAAIKADPAPLADYDPYVMEGTFRQLAYARENALRAELLTALASTEFGNDDPAWTSRQARDAIDALLASGDRAGAVRLLPLILAPRIGLELLADRRYEAIWPDVEAWAGGDLRAQRDAYVAATRAAFAIDPSLQLRRNYATALAEAGRTAEAKALLEAALADPAQWDETRFDIAMIAIRLAMMRDLEGDTDGALAALRTLKVRAPASRYEAVANVVPNEARVLIHARRFGEALALLDAETPPVSQMESEAALGFFKALRLCALRGLGRSDEAAALASELATRFAVNEAAGKFAAACDASPEERRRQWMAALQSPDSRGAALLDWLAADQLGRNGRPGADQALVDSLRTDPAARAAFERFGRTLPPSFDDAIAAWQAPAPKH